MDKTLIMFLYMIFCLICSARADDSTSCIVQTTEGKIEGTTVTLYDGKMVNAFLGVPYAAPPTGRNRFAPPQPLAPRTATLPTKKVSNGCLQSVTDDMRKTKYFVNDGVTSDDCLYLNIWKPQNPKENKMAVMIWIHGGFFVGGSGSMPLYNGGILASNNGVIVVSINYRLAQYGFLYLNDTLTPGNAGIRDQIQAIKWIKNNIEAFGGDPNRITLFGQSAGAISATLHLVNNEVNSMFQNAILESGTYEIPVETCSKTVALDNSLTFAKSLGCPVENYTDTLDCLTKIDLETLRKTSRGIIGQGTLTSCPVINGMEVPLDVRNAAKNFPDSQKKNILGGNVPREATFIAPDFFGQPLTDDFTVTLPLMKMVIQYLFQLQDDRLWNVFLHEYKTFDSTYNESQVRIEAISAISDVQLLCPQTSFMKEWITDTNKVYYYYFDYLPSKPLKFPVPKWAGPTHGEEIPMVFGAPMDPKNGYSDEDKQMSKTIMAYWTNFAKTGDPNVKGSQATVWPALVPNGNFTHIKFQKGATIESFMRERQCDFWATVYPNLLSVQYQLANGK